MLLAGSKAIVVVLCLILLRKIVYLQLKENIVLFDLYVKVHSLLFVITTLTQLSSLECGI